MKRCTTFLTGFILLVILATAAPALIIETVSVGNPGNVGEWSGESYGGVGPDAIVGAVDYAYNIGKYEVTAGQYAAFLNAVAATDPYGLYSMVMDIDSGLPQSEYGCNIKRLGISGSYSYAVGADWVNRPVNLVSWHDAVRFTNWLTNGNTEAGSYTITGGGYNSGSVSIPSAAQRAIWAAESMRYWLLPSEDEWYKAAYHKNDGVTGNYFDYPTGFDLDSPPSNDLVDPTDPGNNATFLDNGLTIDSPYYRTEVGSHENSDSPYGTFDQGGNVFEWNEVVIGQDRGLRGGQFYSNDSTLHASYRTNFPPSLEGYYIGFRVVTVPSPSTITLLLCGLAGLALLRRWR